MAAGAARTTDAAAGIAVEHRTPGEVLLVVSAPTTTGARRRAVDLRDRTAAAASAGPWTVVSASGDPAVLGPPQELVGVAVRDLVPAGAHDALEVLLTQGEAGVVAPELPVLPVVPAQGRASWVDVRTCHAGSGVVHLHCWDATHLMRALQRAQELGLHDPLTGLANRVLFTDRLGQELARERRTGLPIAVLFLDVDDFKDVNDTYGHRAGDLLLSVIATRVRHALRPGDTAARLGGDEFAALCPEVRDAADARELARRVAAAVAAEVQLGPATVRVTVSVGVTLADHTDLAAGGAEDVLARADTAMYRVKRSRR